MGSGRGSGIKQEYEKHPFQLSVDKVASELGVNIETGLTSPQIEQLRKKYGENKLMGQGGVKWYAVLLKQIANAMILVSPARTAT